MAVAITALNIYPIKSCRGIALETAAVDATGPAGSSAAATTAAAAAGRKGSTDADRSGPAT